MWRAGEEGKGRKGAENGVRGDVNHSDRGRCTAPHSFPGLPCTPSTPQQGASRGRAAGRGAGRRRRGGREARGRASLAPSLGRPLFAPPPRRSPAPCSAARARTAPGTGSVGARDKSAPGTNLPVRYKGGGELLARTKGRAKRGPRMAGRRRGERGAHLLSLLAPTQHLAAPRARTLATHTRARPLLRGLSAHAQPPGRVLRRRRLSSAATNPWAIAIRSKKKKKMSSAKAQAGRQAAHDYSVRVVNEDLCKREPVLATVLAWGWLLKQVRGRRDFGTGFNERE
jgi:hypothetical protein